LLLVKRSSSPRSFLQETTWPPCRLTCKANQAASPASDGETPSKPQPNKQCGADRSGNKRGWSTSHAVRTRAEAPLGERSTTWATPFQSLITSSPDLGSMELTKRPMLIDGQPSSKQRAARAAHGGKGSRARTKERGCAEERCAAAVGTLVLMRRKVRSPWCRHWGRFGCYGQAARGGGQAAGHRHRHGHFPCERKRRRGRPGTREPKPPSG
jgi:hypothetical protein